MSCVNVIISPGCIFASDSSPILARIKRKVGNPTLAVIFLTCLFFPSVNITFSQLSGMFFLKRIGGNRS